MPLVRTFWAGLAQVLNRAGHPNRTVDTTRTRHPTCPPTPHHSGPERIRAAQDIRIESLVVRGAGFWVVEGTIHTVSGTVRGPLTAVPHGTLQDHSWTATCSAHLGADGLPYLIYTYNNTSRSGIIELGLPCMRSAVRARPKQLKAGPRRQDQPHLGTVVILPYESTYCCFM